MLRNLKYCLNQLCQRKIEKTNKQKKTVNGFQGIHTGQNTAVDLHQGKNCERDVAFLIFTPIWSNV